MQGGVIREQSSMYVLHLTEAVRIVLLLFKESI
jgi:hypothetical protein